MQPCPVHASQHSGPQNVWGEEEEREKIRGWESLGDLCLQHSTNYTHTQWSKTENKSCSTGTLYSVPQHDGCLLSSPCLKRFLVTSL